MTRDYAQSNGLPDDDQWEVIEREDIVLVGHQHVWRLVRLRNAAGRRASGFQCIDCRYVERVTDRELLGHGRRVERSEK